MKNKILDLKNVICPLNYAKAKLFLEEVESGEQVEIILDEGPPLINVTRSLKEDGHKILKVTPDGDGKYKILIEKGDV